MPTVKSFGTHDGIFHADEVTACALLISFGFIDHNLIFRTRNESILAKCEYVCDVGGLYDPKKKRFDHHPVSYQGDLSSAGMILKYLKDQKTISKDLYNYFNEHFVLGVDRHDIGTAQLVKGTASFSQVIANFLPVEYDAKAIELDCAFEEALLFVVGYLERLKKRFSVLESSRKIISLKMKEKSQFLVFEEAFSWVEPFFLEGGEKHPALFIVMKMKNSWKLRAVPPSWDHRMGERKPLPKAWAGLEGKELEKVSKIPGAIFCHKGLFVAYFKTKEAVMKALDVALGK